MFQLTHPKSVAVSLTACSITCVVANVLCQLECIRCSLVKCLPLCILAEQEKVAPSTNHRCPFI